MEEITSPPTTTQKNKWKPLTIVFIITSVLFAGTTMFFVIQSIHNSKKNNEPTANSEQDTREECTNEVVVTPETNEGDDLVVSEWGIRFRKPLGFTELSYSISDNRLDFSGHLDGRYMVKAGMPTVYGFRFNSATTDNFSYLMRYPENDDPCTGTGPVPGCIPPLVSLGGFNYYFVPPCCGIEYSVTREEHLVFTAAYLLTFMAAHMEAV